MQYFNDIQDFLDQADSIEGTTIPVLKGELANMDLSAIFRSMRAASSLTGAEAMNCTKVALTQNAYIEDEYSAYVGELDDTRQRAIEKGWEYYQTGHYCCLLEYNDDNTDYTIGFNLELRVLIETETDTPVAVNVYYDRDHSTRQVDGKMETKLIDTNYDYQEESRKGLLASSAEIVEHFLVQTIGCANKSRFHHEMAATQLYKTYSF